MKDRRELLEDLYQAVKAVREYGERHLDGDDEGVFLVPGNQYAELENAARALERDDAEREESYHAYFRKSRIGRRE